jgi:putative MATE family efflux protein
MQRDLTQGNITKILLQFSGPYLVASFLQTFYGMADLFITGQFNGAGTISAVAVGSQVMHMLTVVIVGLAMGSTVSISHAVGAKDSGRTAKSVGNSVTLFSAVAAAATVLLLLSLNGILRLLAVPPEAYEEARRYLSVCFAGVPFIIAYNVISSIFRGLGDTRRPMIFVAIAGVFNVGLDYLLIGPCAMGAAGAALATVISQAGSVVLALISLRSFETGVTLSKQRMRYDAGITKQILGIGIPVALQDGLIQISFLVITAIANSRGVDVAAAVGIVEKIISFLFLVPSAMLSTVSALAAQNAGAGKHERSRRVLNIGVLICLAYGAVIFIVCQFVSEGIVSLFVRDDPHVVELGGQYLRTYSIDTMLAGVHFCFSGFFSAYRRSVYSFIHNMISAVGIRIPGAYLASVLFPLTMYPMGLAAPLGSLVSVGICLFFYRRHEWK